MNDLSLGPLTALNHLTSAEPAFAIATLLVCAVVTIASFKVLIAWFGDATPGYVQCTAWLLVIGAANYAAAFVVEAILRYPSAIVTLPLAGFLTLYLTSCAAKSELFTSLVIMSLHLVVSAVGTSGVLLAATFLQPTLGISNQSASAASTSATAVDDRQYQPTESSSPLAADATESSPLETRSSNPRHVPGTANPFFQN
ncbi:hypothetical protein [Stieleria mannarensis]|uniref:hypothetical protein n=1 Tax=Stieleria mannarensis TaxID=2755585 RepID=UPI0015FF0414|nr:hypothetical protein [Rhodopirellula sp. JC639]